MHRTIRQHDERRAKHSKTNDILPQSLCIEAKGAQNRRPRNFNVDAVFVVDQAEILDFIDDDAFKSVMEYR